MITGMIRPFSGKIFLDNLDVTQMPMYERALNGLGYLSQEPSVFTNLTVEENIRVLLEIIEPIPPDQFDSKINELIIEIKKLPTSPSIFLIKL